MLDQQLQDTIYQFEHKMGVVQRIDESSRQLATALESGVPIIITTLQKFPFVSRQLLKMAEERGEKGSGTLQTRRCAVIIDEAHSSQGGEAATELKGVLGGVELLKKAKEQAAEEGLPDMEELFRSMAKRARQANLSFFAFTATPKHKTLAVFGSDENHKHKYTMRQAIEEGFILDVLKNYTTYKTYFKLLRTRKDDPNVERKKAAKALARFLKLHSLDEPDLEQPDGSARRRALRAVPARDYGHGVDRRVIRSTLHPVSAGCGSRDCAASRRGDVCPARGMDSLRHGGRAVGEGNRHRRAQPPVPHRDEWC